MVYESNSLFDSISKGDKNHNEVARLNLKSEIISIQIDKQEDSLIVACKKSLYIFDIKTICNCSAREIPMGDEEEIKLVKLNPEANTDIIAVLTVHMNCYFISLSSSKVLVKLEGNGFLSGIFVF